MQDFWDQVQSKSLKVRIIVNNYYLQLFYMEIMIIQFRLIKWLSNSFLANWTLTPCSSRTISLCPLNSREGPPPPPSLSYYLTLGLCTKKFSWKGKIVLNFAKPDFAKFRLKKNLCTNFLRVPILQVCPLHIKKINGNINLNIYYFNNT